MPCQSDYMRDPGPSVSQRTQAELDRLTRENDLLREYLLRLQEGKTLTASQWARITRDQTAHRKEDLARLEQALRAAVAVGLTRNLVLDDLYFKLGRVVAADPSRPLEPQLGFDPDSV